MDDYREQLADAISGVVDASLRGNPPVVFSPRLGGVVWKAGINAGDDER